MFVVYRSHTPYLEFYKERPLSWDPYRQPNENNSPVSKHSLVKCRNISAVIEINPQERPHEFVITLDTYMIRLSASNEFVMKSWIESLKFKLSELNIIQCENLYSKGPELLNNTNENNNTESVINNQRSDDIYESIFDLTNEVQRISLNSSSSMHSSLEEGPPPYEFIFNNNSNSSNNHHHQPPPAPRPSFRETQVENLKKEMSQFTGLTLKVIVGKNRKFKLKFFFLRYSKGIVIMQ